MDNEDNLNSKDLMVDINQRDSQQNEKIGEAPIKTYKEVVPDNKAKEDIEEKSSTDDV